MTKTYAAQPSIVMSAILLFGALIASTTNMWSVMTMMTGA